MACGTGKASADRQSLYPISDIRQSGKCWQNNWSCPGWSSNRRWLSWGLGSWRKSIRVIDNFPAGYDLNESDQARIEIDGQIIREVETMEFVLGVIVGALAYYVILRERINMGRLLWIVAIVLLALIFVGGLLFFPVTEELTRGEVRETRHEIFLLEWMEEMMEIKDDHP